MSSTEQTDLAALTDRVADWRAQLPPDLPPAGPELLVALDIDGTLLGPGAAVSDEVRQALGAVQAAGAHVVLATGRSILAAAPLARDFGLTGGHVVCSNGAVTAWVDDGDHQLTDVITFDPGPAVRLLQAEVPGVLVAVEDVGRGFKVNRPFPPGELDGAVEVLDLEELIATPASRITVRAPDLPPHQFADQVADLGLHGVNYAVTVGVRAWLDITPEGVHKARGLQLLSDRLGIAPGATVAIGDGGNDVQMLRWAAHGVAMGHAQADVQQAADAITDSVADDGAAVVLDALTSG